jgi:hypothetical protein
MTVYAGIVDTGFRQHVLGGWVPDAVADLKRVISAQELAVAIIEGIEKKRSRIVIPSIGRLFHWIEVLLPGVMDRYLRGLSAAGRPFQCGRGFAPGGSRPYRGSPGVY